MPKFRRPWPVTRRDTDGVQANTAAIGDEKPPAQQTARADTSSSEDQLPQGTVEQAEKDLKAFSTLHRWDPNLERM